MLKIRKVSVRVWRTPPGIPTLDYRLIPVVCHSIFYFPLLLLLLYPVCQRTCILSTCVHATPSTKLIHIFHSASLCRVYFLLFRLFFFFFTFYFFYTHAATLVSTTLYISAMHLFVCGSTKMINWGIRMGAH